MERADRGDEVEARRLVSGKLGLQVRRNDFGTGSSDVDAIIVAQSGECPLEVIQDGDAEAQSQWAALVKRDHQVAVPGMARAWYVGISDEANVRLVEKLLKLKLPALDGSAEASARYTGTSLPVDLRGVGVTFLDRMDSIELPVAFLQSAGRGGVADGEIADWVEDVLQTQDDVARKLAAHGGQQQHAFIWATFYSDYAGNFPAQGRGRLPLRAPKLPGGITDVWVASTVTPSRCLHFNVEQGWQLFDLLSGQGQ